MKPAVTILLTVFLSALLQAQDLNTRITLDVKKGSLESVLNMITARTGIRFAYNPQAIPVDAKVSLKVKDQKVSDVLEKLFTKYGIHASFVEGQYVLLPAQEQTSLQSQETPVNPVTLSGFVREKKTGEALIGVNVYLKGTTTGTFTNMYGYYSLTVDPGTLPVVFSFIGFNGITKELMLSGDTIVDVTLEESVLEIPEVVVVAKDSIPYSTPLTSGDFDLNQKTLARMPAFAGNIDVIKAIQLIPGIRSFGDGSSLYYVRGGNSDQNMVMLDEAPIYNPSHLFGVFSAISPGAINTINVYKGDFPVWYGNRLSSVTDIVAREGNRYRFSASGNIGPYVSSLLAEGPIIKGNSGFLITGRVSTVNWLGSLAPEYGDFSAFFYDINAKFNFRLNQKNRIYLTFFSGNDRFDRTTQAQYRTFGVRWDNLAATLRWNHVFGPRLFSNTTAIFSRYRYFLNLSEETSDNWQSMIANLTLKSDLTWYLNPDNTIRTGLLVTGHRSDPGNVTLDPAQEIQEPPDVSSYNSLEYVFYAGNEQKIGRALNLVYGIRLPVWQDFGATSVYYFDANYEVIDTSEIKSGKAYATFFSPEPRLSVRWNFGSLNTLQVGYTRMTQFLHLLSNSTGPFTSLEVWVPSGPNMKPSKADQVTAGYTRSFPKSAITLSAEAFYKNYTDYPDYKDHANLLYNPLLEGEIRMGNASSYGIEALVRKSAGDLTGWIGYTWCRSFITTPGVNDGERYRANWDSPHNIYVNLSYEIRSRLVLSATWIYLTGNPITTPVGFYSYNGYTVPVYGEKNNSRLPDYHRLDFSASYALNKPGKRYRHSIMLTLYNLYGRSNPFSINFNKYVDDAGNFLVPGNQDGTYQRVPTTLSVAGIVPSINYQFKF